MSTACSDTSSIQTRANRSGGDPNRRSSSRASSHRQGSNHARRSLSKNNSKHNNPQLDAIAGSVILGHSEDPSSSTDPSPSLLSSRSPTHAAPDSSDTSVDISYGTEANTSSPWLPSEEAFRASSKSINQARPSNGLGIRLPTPTQQAVHSLHESSDQAPSTQPRPAAVQYALSILSEPDPQYKHWSLTEWPASEPGQLAVHLDRVRRISAVRYISRSPPKWEKKINTEYHEITSDDSHELAERLKLDVVGTAQLQKYLHAHASYKSQKKTQESSSHRYLHWMFLVEIQFARGSDNTSAEDFKLTDEASKLLKSQPGNHGAFHDKHGHYFLAYPTTAKNSLMAVVSVKDDYQEKLGRKSKRLEVMFESISQFLKHGTKVDKETIASLHTRHFKYEVRYFGATELPSGADGQEPIDKMGAVMVDFAQTAKPIAEKGEFWHYQHVIKDIPRQRETFEQLCIKRKKHLNTCDKLLKDIGKESTPARFEREKTILNSLKERAITPGIVLEIRANVEELKKESLRLEVVKTKQSLAGLVVRSAKFQQQTLSLSRGDSDRTLSVDRDILGSNDYAIEEEHISIKPSTKWFPIISRHTQKHNLQQDRKIVGIRVERTGSGKGRFKVSSCDYLIWDAKRLNFKVIWQGWTPPKFEVTIWTVPASDYDGLIRPSLGPTPTTALTQRTEA
ncbi:hypothetical protein CF327_g6502 [Tilletia walkeri]|nr:hypothetical protein CF327_g6502 [Tilletia walkeri]